MSPGRPAPIDRRARAHRLVREPAQARSPAPAGNRIAVHADDRVAIGAAARPLPPARSLHRCSDEDVARIYRSPAFVEQLNGQAWLAHAEPSGKSVKRVMRTLFTTSGISRTRSFGRWREAIFERIVPVEQARIGEQAFEGSLEAADIGSLLITHVSQGALRTEATPGTIRSHRKQATLSVVIKLAGTSSSAQGERESVQRPGDIVVLDRAPTVLTSSHGSRSFFLELPRERLESMLGPARLYNALTIEASQAGARLVGTFFNELVRVHDALDPDTASRMASIGVDLLVASIGERLGRENPKPLHGTLVVQRAKAHVEAHLGDPMLDPPGLAAAMGVSLRRLQELFHERGRHVSDWIWERRLETAARRLADRGCAHLPIGSIAYGCGFVSQAHFARRFKDRFGLTPREYRAMAAQGETEPGMAVAGPPR